MRKTSAAFRRRLAEELVWLKEQEVVTSETADRIRDIYNLEKLGEESSERLSWVIYLLGILLIACGVIAFVTYHWETMPARVQFTIITLAMLGSHLTGYWLWKVRRRAIIGHSFVVLGTLIFFADIGLTAQIFQVSSDGAQSFLALYFGALAVAFAVESVPNFLIAVVGILIWSLNGLDAQTVTRVMFIAIAGFYFVASGLFVHRTRSSVSLVFAYLIAVVLGCSAMARFMYQPSVGPIFFSPALFALAAPGVSSLIDLNLFMRLSGKLQPEQHTRNRYAHLFEGLSLVLGSLAALMVSYRDFARHLSFEVERRPYLLTLSALAAVVVVGLVLIRLRRRNSHGDQTGTHDLMLSLCGSLILVSSFSSIFSVLAGNVAAVIYGAHSVKTGLDTQSRRRFWFGLILLVLVVMMRFFEYETGLLLKSAAFVGSGILVIAGGVIFESRVRAKR